LTPILLTVGLLVNFKNPKAEIKRMILDLSEGQEKIEKIEKKDLTADGHRR